MLGIGKAWKDWVGYSAYGTAFFGINSIPLNVTGNIYQIKCMCSKPYNNQEYEIKYLQINLDDGFTLDFLSSLKSDYVKKSKYYGHFTDNQNVYLVTELSKPQNIEPHSYNAKNIHSLFKRLSKMKKQTKPILK